MVITKRSCTVFENLMYGCHNYTFFMQKNQKRMYTTECKKENKKIEQNQLKVYGQDAIFIVPNVKNFNG